MKEAPAVPVVITQAHLATFLGALLADETQTCDNLMKCGLG
jgi:hypothetical protein